MDQDDTKGELIKLQKKYNELKKLYAKLRATYKKLKEDYEIDKGQIQFLRKENEHLKTKYKKNNTKKKKPSETCQGNMVEEQYSQFLVKNHHRIESSGKIGQVNPDQSVYLDTNESLIYQGFFIIGPKPETLSKECIQSDILLEYYPPNCTIGANIKSIIPLLCFPNGITAEKALYINDKARSIFDDHSAYHRSRKYFITTIRNENICPKNSQIPNSEHELLYLICIEFDDLVQGTDAKWLVPKCYCLASFIPAFELHFKLVSSLLMLRKIASADISLCENAREELSNDEKIQLDCFTDCEELIPGRMIQLGIEKVDMIRYRCPSDLSAIDISWTCIPLINSLVLEDFVWLIFAVAQEKSVVFLSGNLGLVTSCILALHSLLRPLKWPNLIIPLVPHSLLEMIEAPIPLIAGATYVAPAVRDSLSIIWVLLDEGSINERLQKNPEISKEVIVPKNFLGAKALEEMYGKPNPMSVFSDSQDLVEKSFRIREVFREFWVLVLNGYIKNEKKIIESEFVKVLAATQMFTTTLDQIGE